MLQGRNAYNAAARVKPFYVGNATYRRILGLTSRIAVAVLRAELSAGGTSMVSTLVAPLIQNRLLNSFKFQDSFSQDLEYLELPSGMPLYEADQVPKYAYFLDSGMASEVADTSSGECLEIAITGNEGVTGIPGLLKYSSAAIRCMMQLSGSGRRIRADSLIAAIEQEGLRGIFDRYLQSRFIQISQIAVCAHLHAVEERLARWLLTSADYSESPHFELTHGFLSVMLGANRSTVSLAAGVFQSAGLIDYSRGKIKILDREKLESAACECYLILRRERTRFLNPEKGPI
jgi:CRP-like cAMP-binding protein